MKKEDCVTLNVNGDECEMYLIRASRLCDEEYLDDIVSGTDNYDYFMDEEEFPVCVACPCRGTMRTFYPFSKYSVRFNLQLLNKRLLLLLPS